MSDKPRFTIELRIRDNQMGEADYRHAIGCDDAMRISQRVVEDIKAPAPFGMTSFDQTIEVMKKREFRRDLLLEAARVLAGQMANRLEDAEGWHDESRKEPAQAALGGSWSK